MTVDTSPKPARRFVQDGLPWVIGAAALAVYLATVSHWVTLSNLALISRANGWDWQPMLSQPLLCLLTLPFHGLPAGWVPLALNAFTAICAALTLATLARSVALLPHDRLEQQRLLVQDEHALLSVPDAWVPVVLASHSSISTLLSLGRMCAPKVTALGSVHCELKLPSAPRSQSMFSTTRFLSFQIVGMCVCAKNIKPRFEKIASGRSTTT